MDTLEIRVSPQTDNSLFDSLSNHDDDGDKNVSKMKNSKFARFVRTTSTTSTRVGRLSTTEHH